MNYKSIFKTFSLSLLALALAQAAQAMELPQEEINKKLSTAVYAGNAGEVAKLLDHGGPKDKYGDYLILASYKGYSEIVTMLLTHGANINVQDPKTTFTPLIYASKLGRSAIVKILLNHGADLDYKDNLGKTALDIARNKQYTEIEAMLINEIQSRAQQQLIEKKQALSKRLLELPKNSQVFSNATQQAQDNPTLKQSVQDQKNFSYPFENNLALIAPICGLNRQ